MGVMDERSSRIFVGLCLLVLLWIGTYWLYEPGRPASGADVSFAGPIVEPVADPEPDPVLSGEPAITIADPTPPQTGPGIGTAWAPERIDPPEFREYVVRDDDTFKSIARDELGNIGLWTAIARSNPLKDPKRLKAGDVIRLPLDPSNIQGRVLSGDEPASPGVAKEDPWVEYTVQSGDSLSRIAQAYYGSSRHARAIFEANRDQLSSPDAVKIGQVLLLPPITADD